MRAAIIVSLIAHIAVLQWVLNGLPSARPIELSTIEALPVDLVPIGEITDIAKGQETAKPQDVSEETPPWPTEVQNPVVPEPAPAPPPPEEAMAPPEPEPAPVAEPEPIPPLEVAQPEAEPEVIPPLEQAQAEPPPEPEPVAEPPPPPPEPEPAPPPPEPEPAPPPPPVEKAEAPSDPAPVPKSRPRPPRVVAQAEPAPSDLSDKIAALLDQQKESPPQSNTPASIGTRTGRDNAAMTQTELDALASKMRGCWSPPLGATGADELRTVVLIRLNRDGSLAGVPQIVSRPPGRYETTAPESVVRAIGRCAPYDLPSDKYAEWREIEFDFYPVDMF
jgi:hypothetical protein